MLQELNVLRILGIPKKDQCVILEVKSEVRQSRIQKHVTMLRKIKMLIEGAKKTEISSQMMLKGENVMLQYLTYN